MLLDAFEMTDRRVVGFIKVENATMTCFDFRIRITGHSNLLETRKITVMCQP